MAWNFGFFNSVNGDRVYNAEQLSKMFEGLISNGVYESVGNKLAVQPNSGMTIQIASGRGYFNHHWVSNDNEYLLALEASDVTLSRYAAICIRVDNTDAVRSAVPYIKYGEYATNPVKPTMGRSDLVNEYCLAYILIRARATAITAADIEDTRFDTDLCGWVTGLITQVNTTTLYEQWEAMFNDWFNNLTSLINENTETMLVSAMPVSTTIEIPVSQWMTTDDGYSATLEVAGMTATKIILCEPVTTDVYSAASVQLTGQATGTLTFTASKVPTAAIQVKIVYMGV